MPVMIVRKAAATAPAPVPPPAMTSEEEARHAIGGNNGPALDEVSSLAVDDFESDCPESDCDDSIQFESEPGLDRGDEHEVSFGRMIKEIRQEAGVSQRELSDLSGVSRGALRKIESDDRDGHIRTIARLAKVLGYEIDLIAVNPLPPKSKRKGRRDGVDA